MRSKESRISMGSSGSSNKLLETAVALIVFRRPDVTKRVLEAIRELEFSRLYVIADGPRENKVDEEELVTKTRKLIDEINWKCEVIKIYSDTNLGLRERVLTGLDEVFNREESAIILEDDCLPSADFFTFANNLLPQYSQSKNVALISGNNFAPNSRLSDSYYFSTEANIWGWATWARTWHEFRATAMEDFLTKRAQEQIANAIPSFIQRASFRSLLRNSINLDSWAIQFSAYCYLRGHLAVVPKVNLVTNIGFGVDSTHTKFESYVDEIQAEPLNFPLRHPRTIQANLREVRRESRVKTFGWFVYPLLHPFDFLGRVIRYLKN